jgi:hypothetical protein
MRTPRYFLPGAVHHVITRLVDRDFMLDIPGARAMYLSLLGRALANSDWSCVGYGLMSNHVHDVLIAGEQEPERLFKRVHSPFAGWLNQQRGGLGPVVAERPTIIIVPDSAVAKVLAYVHNNPVRAGLVAAARDSTWTSHRAYLGVEAGPSWLRLDEGRRRSGISSPDELDDWVNREVGADDHVVACRRLQQRASRLLRPCGVEPATTTTGQTPEVALVARRVALVRPSAVEVLRMVAHITGVETSEVAARGPTTFRRHGLRVGAHFAVPMSELSAALGFSRQYGDRILRSGAPVDEATVATAVQLLADGHRIAVDEVATVPEPGSGRIAGRS